MLEFDGLGWVVVCCWVFWGEVVVVFWRRWGVGGGLICFVCFCNV